MNENVKTFKKNQNKLLISAFCGMIAPVLFLVMVIIESLIRPDIILFTILSATLVWAPLSILQNVNFMIFGILTIIFALGFRACLPEPHGKALKSGVWLVIIFGFLIFFAGVFPENYGSGEVHTSVSAFSFLTIIAAQLLIWKGLKNKDNAIWGKYRTYSLISGLLSIIFLIKT